MAYHVFVDELAVHLGMGEHVWARSHETHVADEHIEELWQFVDVIFSDEVAEGELARIVLGGLLAVSILVDVHRAELIAPEGIAVETRALLFEEDGSGTLYFDDATHYECNGDQKEAGHTAHCQIKGTLERLVIGLHQCRAMVGEEDMITYAYRTQTYVGACKGAWYIVEINHVFVAGAYDALDLTAHLVWQTAVYDVYTGLLQQRAVVFLHHLIELAQCAQIVEIVCAAFDGRVAVIAQ